MQVISAWYSPSNLSEGKVTFQSSGGEFSLPLTINKSSDILFNATHFFNFSNYTIFPLAGEVRVLKISVTNEQGLSNQTPPEQNYTFYLWSKANISDLWLDNEVNDTNMIFNDSLHRVFCKVVDKYSSAPIENYPVNFSLIINQSFYIFLGQSLTNSSGISSVLLNATALNLSLGSYNISCEISKNESLHYDSYDKKIERLKVVDLEVYANTSKKILNFGESLEIIGRVRTDGSGIARAWANLSFFEINLSLQKLESKTERINLTCTKESAYLYNCFASFIPKASGPYNVTIYAESSYDGRIRENKTSFFVNFGKIEVNFTYPNYRILENQTFNQTLRLVAKEGDLWNVTLNLSLLQSKEVLANLSPTIEKGIYLKSGIPKTYNFTFFSKNPGLVKMILRAENNYNLSAEFQEIHEVVKPLVEVKPETSNISEPVEIKVKIVGNLSGIKKVNLTLKKPFGEGIENLTLSFLERLNESICFPSVAIGKDVASLASGGYAEASDNPEDTNLSINGEEDDFWVGVNKGNITFIFNGTYAIARIELLAKSDEITNVTLYYYKDGSWNFLLNETITSSKSLRNLSKFTPFSTSKIKLEYNLSGNLYIYEFRAYSVSAKLGYCWVYNLTYKPEFSGKYEGLVSTFLEKGAASSNLSFFTNFGTPNITFTHDPYYFIPGKGEVEVNVRAEGGDLRNLTLTLSSENTSLINITSQPFQNITILANTTKTFSFSCNVSTANEERTNLTLNITSEFGITGRKKVLAIVVENDTEPPTIHQAFLNYNTTNLFGIGDELLVYVNATDNDTMITKVGINIANSEYNQTIISAERIGDSDLWVVRINNSFLNLTGNYSIEVYAWDVKNKAEYQKNLSLYVSNILFVEPKYTYSLFNRGENLSFIVKNLNNHLISQFNWTLELEHKESNFSLQISGTGDEIRYFINSSFPTGRHLVKINASKNGNFGNLSLLINVSNKLYPEFVYYRNDLVSYPNVDLSPIYINVYNARKDTLLSNLSVNVSLRCPNSYYSTLPFQSSFGEYTNIFYLSTDCKTPSSYDTQYSLQAYAKDIFNNSGEISLSFRTASLQRESGGGGGGGGGRGAIEGAFFPTNLTENRTIYIYKNVSKVVKDFSVNLSRLELSIIAGEEESFAVSITNKGDVILGISLSGMCECCNLSFEQTNVSLRPKESKDVKIDVHVPLYQKEGCFAKLLFANSSLQKEKAVKISLVPNPLLHKVEVISTKLIHFNRKLDEYKKAGLDVKDLEKEINEIQNLLFLAEDAIAEDNLSLLKQYLGRATEKSEKLEKSFPFFDRISWILTYKYLILLSLASSLGIAYWIKNITIPLIKLKKQLEELKRKEALIIETRKNTERQYFHRKISEDVFNKIMIEEQNKLLKVRSEIREIEKKIDNLLHLRLKK